MEISNLKFVIPGNPISLNTAYPTGRDNRRHLSEDGTAFKNDVGWMAKQALNGRKMFKWPIRISIEFYFDDDSHEMKDRKMKQKGHRRDVDNGAKLIVDAMTGVTYNDDSEVVNVELWKDYAQTPRIEIEIIQLGTV